MAEILSDLDPHLELRPRPVCDGRLACDLAALTLPELRSGLVATSAIYLYFLLWRPVRSRLPGPGGAVQFGAPMVLAAAGAYFATGHLLPWLAVAVLVLSAGGYLAGRWGPGLLGRLALSVPGGLLLSATPALRPLVPTWCLALLFVTVCLGAACASDLDDRFAKQSYAPVCLAVSVVAAYETVPDTDLFLVLLPLAVLVVPLAWPRVVATLGSTGIYGLVGFLSFAVVVGGRGRLSSVVGASACLGLLVLEPIARRLNGGGSVLTSLPHARRSAVAVGAVQLLVLMLATRLAGTRDHVGSAVLISVTALAVAMTLLVVGGRVMLVKASTAEQPVSAR